MVKKKNGSGRPKGSKNKKKKNVKKSAQMVLTVNTQAVIAEVQQLLCAVDGKIDSNYLHGFIQEQVMRKTERKFE